MDDEIVSSFAAITDASASVARHYLMLTDCNLEQAIQLFFDSPDLASTATAPQTTSQSASRSASRPSRPANTSDVIEIDSDNDDMDIDSGDETSAAVARSHLEDDEAMARRMQDEMYGGGGSGGGNAADEIRAPIGRTTETLIGPGSNWENDEVDTHDALLEQLRRRGGPSRQARLGVFNQQGDPSIWDETDPSTRRAGLAEATGGASETSSKAARLAELFRPPFSLMCRLNWDAARDKAKEEERWILVNIQDPSIFDCQALNRDIWKHDGIKETVQSNFLFMQYTKDDPQASQYTQYYFPTRDDDASYPHIAIVDPRTGEQVKLWSGQPSPKPMDFLMQLHEFLDRYSLDVTAKNPVAKRKVEKVNVDKLSEEQQLELALRASMGNAQPKDSNADDPDALTKSIHDLTDVTGKATSDEGIAQDKNMDTEEVAGESSAFSQISATNPHTEPDNDPQTTTRIQFRHSGGRVIRRFTVDDSVRRIYEWLKAEPLDGKEGVTFELKSMGGDLIEQIDESIQGAKLKNATVMIEYLED